MKSHDFLKLQRHLQHLRTYVNLAHLSAHRHRYIVLPQILLCTNTCNMIKAPSDQLHTRTTPRAQSHVAVEVASTSTHEAQFKSLRAPLERAQHHALHKHFCTVTIVKHISKHHDLALLQCTHFTRINDISSTASLQKYYYKLYI